MVKASYLLLFGLYGWSAAQGSLAIPSTTSLASISATETSTSTLSQYSDSTQLLSFTVVPSIKDVQPSSSSYEATSSTAIEVRSSSTASQSSGNAPEYSISQELSISTNILQPTTVTVATDGSGQYTAIGAAIAAAQSSGIPTVTVQAGTYTESITILGTATVTIVGATSTSTPQKRSSNPSSTNLVTITNNGSSSAPLTFSTSSSKGITWRNLDFLNTNTTSTAGVAFLRGSKHAFYSCSFVASGSVAFTGSYASGVIANSYIEALDKPVSACAVVQKDGSTNTNVYLAAANGVGSVVLYRDSDIAGFVAGTGVYVDAMTQDARNRYMEFGTTGAGSYALKKAARAAYVTLVTDVEQLAPYDIDVFFASAYPSVAVATVDWIDADVCVVYLGLIVCCEHFVHPDRIVNLKLLVCDVCIIRHNYIFRLDFFICLDCIVRFGELFYCLLALIRTYYGLTVTRTGATVFRGETDNALSSSANKVTISNSASLLSSAGSSSSTATFSANKYESKLVSFYNINIENSATPATNTIALAVYAKGTKVAFYGCNLSSSQGTIYLDYGNFFFSGGTIQGTTDFVWGQGAGYFYNSVIVSEGTTTGQTIAAHKYQSSYGGSQFVFDTCAVVPADTSVPKASTYLGRDYSTNSTVAFINSYLDSHIAAAGWKVASTSTFTGNFVEANNTGPGADTSSRTSGKVLTDTSAYSIKNVLGDDSWLDSAAIAPFSGWPQSVYTQITTSSSATLSATLSATVSSASVSASASASAAATFIVAPTPTAGQYGTISSAIAALPNDSKEYTIYILAGTYEEQISITRSGKVTLRGETTFANDFTQNKVLITFSDGVSTSANQDEETPVVNWKNTNGDGLALYHLNFTNSYPQTSNYAALAADFFGTNMAAYGCAFKGFQDTLLVNQGIQVFSNCYVEGSVDFIWGYSKAYFHQCYIASNTPNSCITAQNRPSSSWAGGFVFDNSVVTYTQSYGTTYGLTCLGRPWSQYAVAVYMNSYLDQHISAAGWTTWSSSDPRTGNIVFGEYNNTGPGSSITSRASFATQLTESQASAYSLESFVGSTSWLDTVAYNYVPSYSLVSTSSPTTTTTTNSTHPTSGTEPPSGAVLVSADGSVSGSYTSLTDALASLPSDSTSQVIFMYPGTYNEQVPSINRAGSVTIIGYTSDSPGKTYTTNQVTITQARGLSVSPLPTGHSNAETATIATGSTSISMYNINIINSDNLDGSQSSYVTLAASIYGNKIGFYGCSFIGWQDTLLTGATAGYQYYESCYIEGAIDFIWGYSKSYFKGCTIGAKRAKSAITAQSRASTSAVGGYIFDQCLFTQAAGSTTDLTSLVYLGRPYSQYALVVVKNSYLDDIIQPAGWKVWSTTDPRTDHITFAEYNNDGPGNWENNTAAREAFGNATLLTSDTYPLESVMDSTSWIDMTYWDSIQTPTVAATSTTTNTTSTAYDGTVPPAGAFIVSKTAIEGKTTYDTIQSALNALPTSSSVKATVFIYPGVYEEQLVLNKSGTTVFLGYSTSPGDYSQNQVTITYNKGIDTQADASNSDSATFYATGNYFQAVNINFANTFGTTDDYASLGFAVRSSKYASLYGCQVYGNQDSLLINGYFFASNSYIEGNIDMIWGSGAGYFLNSTISPNEDGVSLTANKRTNSTTAAGFVFDQCTITPANGASFSSISLGRPWNHYARVAYINSYLDSCVSAAGWSQWSKTSPQTDAVVFGEYGNSGPGSGTSARASFATQLTADSAAQFQLANFFSATSWINMTYVSATPFVASNVTVPSTTASISTSVSTSTSSTITTSTMTVFTTKVSTLKQTTSTTLTLADTTTTEISTTTLDIGATITPEPTTKTTVIKQSTTSTSTLTEADETVTSKSTVTVNIGTTVTPEPTTRTVSSTVSTYLFPEKFSSHIVCVIKIANTKCQTTVTATSTALTTAKASTVKTSITTTTTATSTAKVSTTTLTVSSAATVTKTSSAKGTTVFTTSTKTVKSTTTLSCIPANTNKARDLPASTPTTAAVLPRRNVDYTLHARDDVATTVTVTVSSVLTTYMKTATISDPGSTYTTELLVTKTTGKVTTLKPSTVVETSISATTRLATATIPGSTITTTAITTVSSGKATTLKPATATVSSVITASTTLRTTTTVPLAAVTSTYLTTRTITTVLPASTLTVTRTAAMTSTVTTTLPGSTVTKSTTVTTTLKPSSTVTQQSTVTKTTTKKVSTTVTSVATKTSKSAGACATAA
ncbi:pectin lyase-like protein [Annulohypoxylon stygium]|nr:pectin lyase-like protein [Annulohypoxylon stygium]